MDKFFQSLLGLFAASSIVIPLAVWLFKRTYESKLSQDLESFRAQLNRDLEASKAEWSRFAVEHQIRFSYLHTARAEVISEGYGKLKGLYDAVSVYTSPAGPIHDNAREGARKAVDEAVRSVQNFWYPRIIYLSKESAKTLNDFLELLQRESIKFRFSVDTPQGVFSTREWVDITQQVQDGGKQLLEQLEDDYREILGVT